MKCSRPKRPSILMISIRLLSSELQENRPWEIVSLAEYLNRAVEFFPVEASPCDEAWRSDLLVHKLLTSYIVIHLSHGTVPYRELLFLFSCQTGTWRRDRTFLVSLNRDVLTKLLCESWLKYTPWKPKLSKSSIVYRYCNWKSTEENKSLIWPNNLN